MKLEVNKAQLALLFDAIAQYSRKDIQQTADAYTDADTPIGFHELKVHYDLLVEALSEHVEVEEWSWVNEDIVIDCCHDEDGEEF